MSVNEKQLQDKINGTIWSACDTLRSSIPGANYKDYADPEEYSQILFLYNSTTFCSDDNIKKIMY